jgi:hypothetical protein
LKREGMGNDAGSHTKNVFALLRTERVKKALFWTKLLKSPQMQMLFNMTLTYNKLKLKYKVMKVNLYGHVLSE